MNFVWEVADDIGVTFEQVKKEFLEYGYTEENADDFWNSKWVDVTDTWESMPELEEMFFDIEIED